MCRPLTSLPHPYLPARFSLPSAVHAVSPSTPLPSTPLHSPPLSQPVGARFASGIFFLLDAEPGAKDASVNPLRPPDASVSEEEGGPEASAPEPFEWVVGSYY